MPDPSEAEPAPYQSLYRRFRPQRFEEVLGQGHVSLALRNAVRDERVGHAYLFSGPRGTGKTSTARILAKALNCAAPEEGEPCGRCDSCVEIARGASLDVHELDAASNNGVDAMRDLVSHAALGTPGRWKVYIVDEVHMLSTAASNALLKTLEEPPGHVVFVLATTDAQKVLPTIRSRTQHFEFRLLGSETLSGLVRAVRDAGGLTVPDTVLDAAVRRGRGSARDALSALDQLSAGGAVDDDIEVLAELGGALADRDATRALLAVARAAETGRDPQRLAADLAEYLRQGFLAAMAPDLVTLAGDERAQVEELARRTGLPALVRCLEELGRAQVDMRDVPDPRVHLEVALIKLTHPQADDSAAALLERVDRLERALASLAGGAEAPPPAPRTAAPVAAPAGAPPPVRAEDPAPAPPRPAPGDDPAAGVSAEQVPPGGPDLARATLGAIRRQGGGAGRRGAGRDAPAAPAPAGVEGGTGGDVPGPDRTRSALATLPSRDELVQVWGDGLLAALPNRARARFRVGRFLAVDEASAIFALPNETHRSYCEEVRFDVERALGTHFGRAVPIRLVVDEETGDGTPDGVPAPAAGGASPAPGGDEAAEPDLLDPEVLAAETEPAGAGLTPEERLKQAFPGAHEV